MTLRELKERLKERATSLIPGHLQEYLYTGGSENTHYIYFISAKEFSSFAKREFGKNDISTQIASNKKMGMHTLESFKMPIEDLEEELTELVDVPEKTFVENEFRKLEENAKQALEDPRSSIQQYIEAVEAKLLNGGIDSGFGVMASIGWNSNGWSAPPTEEDLEVANSYDYVKENGHMNESLNFGIDRYPAEADGTYIGYSPKLKKALKKEEDVKIVFFTSKDGDGDRQLVGLYAFPEIGRFKREAVHEDFELYGWGNIKSSLEDILLFEHYLDPETKGYLPATRQLSSQGFNYLYKSNVKTILEDAMNMNPANEKIKGIYSRLFNKTAMVKDTADKAQESAEKVLVGNLNQILFGPPGTGKTYHTVNKALEIIGERIEGKERDEVKTLFDAKVKEGQIMFTTFHQSMSYEDFVEGIKPLKPEQEDTFIKYEVQAGIFKRICQAAKTPNLTAFDSAYESLIRDLSETPLLELKTPTGKVFAVSLNQNGNLNLHTGPEKTKQGTLTRENIQKQINGEVKFEDWQGYFKGVVDYLKSKYQYSENFSKKENYVLIIDEINRGNVSQIFGELITLIEEDKRLGKAEALEVTLPYSKEKFGVPANLHIIGTMNTADRSIEALDTALRRRFSFSEMEPEPALLREIYIPDLDLEVLLTKINKRIERLLDKDHMIGHAYFIKLKHASDPWKELQVIFHEKLIPLLQEYFYGDYGKIELIIGKAFFEEEEEETDVVFADSDYEFVDALLSKKIYRMRNVDGMDAAEFVQAVSKI